MDKWLAGLFILILLLLGIIAFLFSQNEQIQSQISPCYSSYYITQISGNYVSYDCSDFLIDFGSAGNVGGCTGTNASCVIQSTINALRGNCGTLTLAPKIYNLTNNLTDYPCISMVGTLSVSGDFGIQPNSTLLASTNLTSPVITIEVDPLHTQFTVFPQLNWFGIFGGQTGPAQDGINITQVNGVMNDIIISHVLIFQVGGNCMSISNSGKMYFEYFYAEDCIKNGVYVDDHTPTILSIDHGYIFGNTDNGTYIQIPSTAATPTGFISITNDWFYQNGQNNIAVYPTGSTYSLLISGNHIKNAGASTVNFANVKLFDNRNIQILGNSMGDDRGTKHTSYDIFMQDSRTAGTISANNFYTTVVTAYIGFGGGTIPVNLTTTKNQHFNPTGLLVKPWSASATGLAGTLATPGASGGTYTVYGVDQIFVCVESGVGVVTIAIKDNLGNTIVAGLTCTTLPVTIIPMGYKLTITNTTDFTSFNSYGN